MSLIEAKGIVLEAIELAERPQSDYTRMWKLLVNEYRNLNLYHINNVRFRKVEMSNQKIIVYPDDMIKLLGCYVPYQGEIVKLSKKKLVPTTSLQSGVTIRDVEDGEGEAIKVDVLGKVAKPHNVFGYYYDYKRERYIVFMTESRTEVILAYQTNGLTAGDTLIPLEYKNALLYGMLYKDILLRKNTQWRTQEVKMLYDEEIRKLSIPEFNYEDFADAWIGTNTVTR
jgi:hypothetical protein